MKKNFFVILSFLIILIQAFQIIYFERNYFIEKYDVSYWKDRYEHSQYVLPLSKRIIGDDGLFAYAGYRLINGDNPFSINVDKPPLGKYLIGISILIFKNPAYYALFFGIGCLVIFYGIAKYLLKDKILALTATVILFLDPLFFTQLWKSWIDVAQLFFLLANIFFILNSSLRRSKNLLFLIVGGFSLGLFAEIKPPILFPIIFVLETIFLYFKKLKKEYFFFILGIVLGIFLPYLRYYQLNFDVLDVLRVHKFMASIYLQSQLQIHHLAVWQTLFFGRFPDIVNGLPTTVSEWWWLWPIATLFSAPAVLFYLIKKNVSIEWRGISIFLLLTLIIYTIIPSYPRYLIIVLPFLYLLFINFVSKITNANLQIVFLTIIFLYGVVHANFLLQPNPDAVVNNFYYNLSHQYFQDLYQEDLAKEGRPTISREKFRILTQKTLNYATVKAIDIKEKKRNITPYTNIGSVNVIITYKTQNLGSFSEEKIVDVIEENGQWKVKWNWDIILNDFLPEYTVEAKTIVGRRGKIIDAKGKILAQDDLGYLILINPQKIDTKKENEMLKFLESYGYKGDDVKLQNAYLENVLPKDEVPLITIKRLISEKEKEKLLSYAGVRLVEYPSRIYNRLDWKSIKNTFFEECCSRIYSSYNYHGIKGEELDYDAILWGYDGGSITIKDNKNNKIREVLQKDKKDGSDVILPL